jgi:HNH endonuclease
MNDLLKQAVKPQSNSSKWFKAKAEKWPSLFDDCPSCGEVKNKRAKMCHPCRVQSTKSPLIKETVYVEREPCRKIPLTQGLYATVDADIYDHLTQWNWYAAKSAGSYSFYAVTGAFKSKIGKGVPMHRMIMNTAPELETDHKNGDTLDNRRSNLRPCTSAQNNANRRIVQKNNSSGYRGVSLVSYWTSRIVVKRKMIVLGRFRDPISAARAYDKAAIKYYGEFAKLNFPPQ